MERNSDAACLSLEMKRIAMKIEYGRNSSIRELGIRTISSSDQPEEKNAAFFQLNTLYKRERGKMTDSQNGKMRPFQTFAPQAQRR